MSLEGLESRKLMSISASLVSVPISAAALAADPNLANYKSYDLKVTLTGDERWTVTDMKATLTKGSFYNVPTNKNGNNFLQPNIWNVASRAMLQNDTAVCAADNFGQPIILGQYDPTVSGNGTFTSTETNVSWGSLQDGARAGTFTVARLTVSKDAVGSITGRDGSTALPSFQFNNFTFGINNGGPVVYSQIGGRVWNDSNSNGKLDSGEAGISGFKVYLDKNNNGSFDSGEKYRLTDSSGNYLFEALTPGTYYVKETMPTGYRRTYPSSSKYTCVLSNGVNGTNKNFGNTTHPIISGTVFNDKNSNGKLDSGEAGLSGFTLYIDANNNGKQDSGEKIAGTDGTGYWVFKTLNSGTYIIRIASKSGYKATSSTSTTVKAASGGQYTGRLFAEHKIA
jgi:hypothetical protein